MEMKQEYLDGSNSLVKQETYGKSELEESEFLRLLEKPQHIRITNDQDGPLSPDQLDSTNRHSVRPSDLEENKSRAFAESSGNVEEADEDEGDQLADNIQTFV